MILRKLIRNIVSAQREQPKTVKPLLTKRQRRTLRLRQIVSEEEQKL